jgi:hypothetical protein
VGGKSFWIRRITGDGGVRAIIFLHGEVRP